MQQSAACKPGSVENGHLSRREVANALKRYCGNRAGSPVRSLHLAPDGVYMTAQSPGRRCALAAPFHPYRGRPRRYLSVALALESPPPAVSRHPALRCPDFPHALAGLRPFSRLCHEGHYTAKKQVRQSAVSVKLLMSLTHQGGNRFIGYFFANISMQRSMPSSP